VLQERRAPATGLLHLDLPGLVQENDVERMIRFLSEELGRPRSVGGDISIFVQSNAERAGGFLSTSGESTRVSGGIAQPIEQSLALVGVEGRTYLTW
jgi:hypothetical protein